MLTLPPTSASEARLAALGEGFRWHLPPGLTDTADAARAIRAGLGVRERSSPLLPESAALAYRLLGDVVASPPSVVGLDADAALLGLFISAGATVLDVRVGSAEGTDDMERLDYPLTDPVPEARRAGADLAIVDTLLHPGAVIPLIARALGFATPTGKLALLVHPLQRAAVDAALALLPIRVAARHQECAVRLLPGQLLSDILWDWWILERTEGASMIPEGRVLGEAEVRSFDPEATTHGCLEMVDVDSAGGHDALEGALDGALLEAGVAVHAAFGHADAHSLHRSYAFAGGGHLACTVDLDERRLALDVVPWTPLLHVVLAGALTRAFPPRVDVLTF